MEERRLQPGEIGELERQAEPLFREANQLLDRIRKTKPVTLAGAIAILECLEYDDETVNLVVEFLRELEARGVGASAPVPIVDTPSEEVVAREFSVEGSPVERRLYEAVARLLPGFLAATASAEKEAGPEVIGFGESDDRR
jgi:hypothetical protein